jgi:DNA replication ATP-dependent helicase Dna2
MFDSMEQIRETFESTYVFGTTCLQMNNNLLLCVNGGKFDYCIMDEASQISEPLALGPILLADKFVMIGDFYQLNPLVKSQYAEKKGLNISLFERICRKHPENVTILKKQYRMSKDILELSNSIVYGGIMSHGNPNVAS